MSTFIQYEGDGSTRIFSLSFTYLNPTHVKVYVNGFLQVNGADYDFFTASSIQFREYRAPIVGAVIDIRRETPVDELLVVFQNSAVLTAEDLNVATRQVFNLAQEIRDIHNARLEAALSLLDDGSQTTAAEMIEAITQTVLESALLAELNTRITDIDSNAESILQQALRLDTIDADFLEEQTARIEGDEAIAETLALMGARSGDNTAFILNTATTRVSPTESMATRLETLTAADEDNAAAIQTVSEVVVGSGGLTAQFMVKTDVNGYVSGFGLYNTGATSEFIILADKFAVVTPGETPKVPFAIVGGVVFMQNVVINGALIEDLSVGSLKIAGGALSNTAQNSAGGFTPTSFSLGSWQTLVTCNANISSAASTILIWASIDAFAFGAVAGFHIRARVRQGTNTLWEGFAETARTVGSSNLAEAKGTYTLTAAGLSGAQTFTLEVIVEGGGDGAQYRQSGLIITELKK